MTILHITSLTAEALAAKLTNYLESTELEYTKLIGQGYDGAAPFSGKDTGVQKRVHTLSGHALYIHLSWHSLSLSGHALYIHLSWHSLSLAMHYTFTCPGTLSLWPCIIHSLVLALSLSLAMHYTLARERVCQDK